MNNQFEWGLWGAPQDQSHMARQQASGTQTATTPGQGPKVNETERPRYYGTSIATPQHPFVSFSNTTGQFPLGHTGMYPLNSFIETGPSLNTMMIWPYQNNAIGAPTYTYPSGGSVQSPQQANSHLQQRHSLSQPLQTAINYPPAQQAPQTQQQQLTFPAQVPQIPRVSQVVNPGLSRPPLHHQNYHSSPQDFVKSLQETLPAPPLNNAPTRPEARPQVGQRRAKRMSKFSKEQDELIVKLKREGKTWVEIADIAKVGNYLAARNRYQVIVGQQGNNNSSSWGQKDKLVLHSLLDSAELEKWQYIAAEMRKATGKDFSDKECREIVRYYFWSDPYSFGVYENTMQEVIKEKNITDKSMEQEGKKSSEFPYIQSLLNNPPIHGPPGEVDHYYELSCKADPGQQNTLDDIGNF
ncbi:Piso0_002265 [Millerozyma farinosa CBS 7064]|uniref:Piso0_002265 protein n=1 Tax=Pichia sorbitophila (strain ATCC MYA-4447 / BCRC 22081 / CBS 7064 / NBRC 10061 / NRRL Y-12695) TaxID=559304 RepID=G8YC54_PICSO|nr:Piso0_002265 [Millerozyma farinosa CBS 7064]